MGDKNYMKYPNCDMTIDLCKGIIISEVLFLIPFLIIPSMEFGFCIAAAHFHQIVHYDSKTLFYVIAYSDSIMYIWNLNLGGTVLECIQCESENIIHPNYKFNL